MRNVVLCGHVLDEIKKIPDESVQCCITSVPYWGLRNYNTPPQIWKNSKPLCEVHEWDEVITPAANGIVNSEMQGKTLSGRSATRKPRKSDICSKCGAWRGELGLEPTPELYVQHIVEVFREARRVLKSNGVLWLNIGDSYASGKGTCFNPGGGEDSLGQNRKEAGAHPLDRGNKSTLAKSNLKPKDMVGIPWAVAFALRNDGWYLRSDIIWAKPNPMPESVTDRPTKSHEYIFLLTKSAKYYYDADAIAEPLAYGSVDRLSQPNLENQTGSDRVPGKSNGNMKAVYKKPYTNESTKDYANGRAQNASATKARIVDSILAGDLVTRNKRSVWEVTTQPFKGAHFATFPEEIPTICIKAGTSEKGQCAKCGKPLERKKQTTSDKSDRQARGKALTSPRHDGNAWNENDGRGFMPTIIETLGWQAQCTCNTGTVPQIVLDPFAGSGTTLEVAKRLGRDYIGIELSEKYVKELVEPRLASIDPLFNVEV